MVAQSNVAPVIIKRKKAAASAPHHSGAWKVAYADFVTAMMAFFLLMWLLNATTEKQRKGLSDYFNPTIAMTRVSSGGDDALSGDSLMTNDTKAHSGLGGLNVDHAGSGLSLEEQAEFEELVKAVEKALYGRGGESYLMQRLLRHVITRVTDEGLVIELFDTDEAQLFKGRSADPAPILRVLARILPEVLNLARNRIAVNGHMQGMPMAVNADALWNISSDRAQILQRLLENSGVAPLRFQRLGAFADRKPAVADPFSRRNNRIEIILLRRDL